MKIFIITIQLIAVSVAFSSATYASGGHRGHHKGHYKQRHNNYNKGNYYQQPGYNAQPQYQDPRSHQGLAGGVVGSVLGYEIGKGDPIATGLGAAAGSYLGNGIAGRR